jgi:hypothetical protein
MKMAKPQLDSRSLQSLIFRAVHSPTSLWTKDGLIPFCTASGDELILNTLGVAQYRTGRYAEALVALTKSEKLKATNEGSRPADLAFLAIAQHQLRNKDEAKTTLGRLREGMQQPRWVEDAEAQGFLREAQELIEGKPAGKKE